jgi:hypothetical protein
MTIEDFEDKPSKPHREGDGASKPHPKGNGFSKPHLKEDDLSKPHPKEYGASKPHPKEDDASKPQLVDKKDKITDSASKINNVDYASYYCKFNGISKTVIDKNESKNSMNNVSYANKREAIEGIYIYIHTYVYIYI